MIYLRKWKCGLDVVTWGTVSWREATRWQPRGARWASSCTCHLYRSLQWQWCAVVVAVAVACPVAASPVHSHGTAPPAPAPAPSEPPPLHQAAPLPTVQCNKVTHTSPTQAWGKNPPLMLQYRPSELVPTFADRGVSHGQCGGSLTTIISVF
jgi:hypothetical protein